ncbi:helicase [Ligilactobacillus pabuli]|uniref:Helicase n=1 Tax=Ligilactobacillus pabuli TaxID=2886039 RepID=A0ABQ5JHE2_9LACO|nr:DEAD/DEAH box helicase [Ligilactobacillus pabuli]GKS80549.1 helicase [Ligilactobacillus pabuli]HIW89357.1 DEAD/DEAH box helicase [Candidatus Ligilactobacillus excrementipullorum]
MNPKFVEEFEKEKFTELSPIQSAVYEPLAAGKNVVGYAPTGSGKTLAYTMPLLETLLPKDGTQLLVLVPSQELAIQVNNVMGRFASLLGMKSIAVIGGANVKRQYEKLKKRPEIVVGTPGRVLSVINEKKLKMHQLTACVIDEADQMLADEESLALCREIVGHAKADVQVAFFSATDSKNLTDVHHWFGIEPEVIDVRQIDQTQGHVVHYLIESPVRKRVDMLRKLANLDDFAGLVFFDSTTQVKDAAEKLAFQHVAVGELSSGQSSQQRKQALTKLRKRQIKLLLTTDVAARGLDIVALPAVVNFDVPRDLNTYIHRSGRTGRMGAEGVVINLGNDHDLRQFKQLARDEGYDLQTGYVYQHQIVTDLAAAQAENKQENKPSKKKSKKVRAQHKETLAAEKKQAQAPKHKKNRKRDRKNKGKPKHKQHQETPTSPKD